MPAQSSPLSDQPLTLDPLLEPLKAQIEAQLADYLRLDQNAPDRLKEAMSYSLMAGGKRLRPALVLLACQACGGRIESALPAACAIEMVHTYSLIHDDLPAMDDDDLRRGRPTNHVVYGEALAILAGDALLTLAFEVLAKDVQPPAVAAACCADLAAAAGACGMVGGQTADLAAETTPVESVEELESIHRRKTGRLLCAALTMGARIAGASPEQFESLKTYGNCVGLAFQIADDLLDVTGSADRLGKQVSKDADLGKQTYPRWLGVEGSQVKARKLIDEAVNAVRPLGAAAAPLVSIAEFVIRRDH